MEASTSSCGVCTLRQIYKPPIVWCTECDEGLCTECQEHHSLSKSSRNHYTISITEYQKLPDDVSNISQYCKIHNEKYQSYCKKHESPCCSYCIVDSHNECTDLEKLFEVIKNAKLSNAFYEIERTLGEVSENIKKIRENRQDNMKTLSDERTTIEHEIEQTRIAINYHLDKLKLHIIKELYETENLENKEIRQLITLLNEKENEIAECQMKISNIKLHASDLQAFLVMKQLETDVFLKDQFLQTLIDTNTLKQNSLTYHLDTTIQHFLSNTKTFGKLLMKANPHDVVLTQHKGKQAQIMVSDVQYKSFEDINLNRQRIILRTGNHIFGCCMLSDGKMAFANHYTFIRVINKDGSRDFDVEIPYRALDIDVINEGNSLVVTNGDFAPNVAIIDIKDKQLKTTLPLNAFAHGIADKGVELIYSTRERGIQMINLQEESFQNIVRDRVSHRSYVATFADNVYHTNSVSCYDLKGNQQWMFKNVAVLKHPLGISVDNDGNVFVVGYESSTVVVISADGIRHRQVLSSKDGIKNPRCVHYDRSTNQLLVANMLGGTAFVYSMVCTSIRI